MWIHWCLQRASRHEERLDAVFWKEFGTLIKEKQRLTQESVHIACYDVLLTDFHLFENKTLSSISVISIHFFLFTFTCVFYPFEMRKTQ